VSASDQAVESLLTPPDVKLVLAARDGDGVALAALIDRHAPRIAQFCRRLAGPHLSDDCTQDTLLLATLRLPRLRDPEAFGAWLRGIAIRVCRRARLQAVGDPLPLPPPTILDQAAPEEDVAGPLALHDTIQTVRAAVDTLPAGQREAVRLFYLAGRSYDETAAQLGIPMSALKTRLHKGRAALRHHLRLADTPAPLRLDDRTLAIHESGHAVLHWAFGGRVARVALAPRAGGHRGLCEVSPTPVAGPARETLQMLMGGEAAVARTLSHHPRTDQGDRANATRIARAATEGDDVEAALFASALERARARLEDPVIWSRVERVAAALTTRRELDADEFRTLVSA
jgi:RNA polymerase sigma factor (sigma-70 family)